MNKDYVFAHIFPHFKNFFLSKGKKYKKNHLNVLLYFLFVPKHRNTNFKKRKKISLMGQQKQKKQEKEMCFFKNV